MRNVVLQGPTDFEGFRSAARMLLRERVAPDQVSWAESSGTASLFDDVPAPAAAESAPVSVPAAFARLAASVALHSDVDRFALLYRLLWRLRSEPRLLQVTMDADVARATLMEKSIHRDIHKMHAFVRFRRVPGVEPATFMAWFEPQHHILEAASPFFVRRFANTPWAIVTPERRAIWDLSELTFGPGGTRSEVPDEDATESLWRSYYASIFNPARLKVQSMRGHMPQKYWRNLPESSLIPELVSQSHRRTQHMIDESVTEPARRHVRAMVEREPKHVADESPSTLHDLAHRCRACPLWQHATQVVFGEGPQDASIVLVGEQPGDQEDLQGRPFVGPAGQLLDRALADAGLDRKALYVTNAVKHFKFEARGKRRLHKTPAQKEVAACHQWLASEIKSIRPKLIVALGATAASSLFGRSVPVMRNRGRIFIGAQADEGVSTRILVTIHPSALLRMPDTERAIEYEQFVRDLQGALPFMDSAHATQLPAHRAASIPNG